MIPIYKHEVADGLEEKIKASRTIAYSSPVAKIVETDAFCQKALASEVKKFVANVADSDLYHIKSILVSSTWNKNDDVFTAEQVWKARHTPEDKPDNLEHDEHCIVGHMTGSWVLDADFNLVPDDTSVENLPPVIHILNSSVVYTKWEDPVMQDKIVDLIKAAESGEMFVSMECLLRDFDYALLKGEELTIVARGEDTSFLTKHLRAYGGNGVYNDYKIGRVVKDITFCGKGYTRTPANPESIILATSEVDLSKAHKINSFSQEGGVIINCTNNTTENQMEKELEELKAKVAELESVKSSFETKVAELVAANKRVEELTAELAEVQANLKAASDKLAEIDAAKARAARVQKLVEVGLEASEVDALIDQFAKADDAQFDAVVSALAATKKKYSESKKECSTVKTETTVETSAASLSPAPGTEESAKAAKKAVLVDSVAGLLNNKKKNKNGDK